MKTVMIAVLAMTATTAKADGFRCEGQNTGLNVKVYNHTQPEMGTRVPAIMVVSDPSIASSRKTIATFKDVNHTLNYQGYGVYKANVDLRFNDSGRQGENIAGTKLGQLKTIKLDVLAFQYNSQEFMPLANDVLTARIDYIKRNGEKISEAATCVRYKKGE